MSICLRLLVQHSFSRAQSNPSQIDTDTSTILHSARQSQPFAEYTFGDHLIAGKSMPSLGYSRCCCTHASMNALEVIHIVGATGIC
jgi:hypothetical protein